MIDMKLKNRLLLTSAMAFNNSGWKLDDNGNVTLKDGNPVYIDAQGRELSLGQDTIARLNAEAKSHREAKEAIEVKFKAFEGLDAEKARKALELTEKLDAKQLLEAGKVDELKNQITSQFTAQLAEKDKALSELQSSRDSLLINNLFAQSDLIRNNLAVPRDMFEATFRGNFKVENGQVVAYGKDGNRLLSKSKAGEYADADEALQLLVEAHPQKDIILKADVGSGTGNSGGGGARGGGRVIRRADFEKLPASQQAEIAGKVGKGEMSLTD